MEVADTTLYSNPDAHGYLKRLIADKHHQPILKNLLVKLGLKKDDTILEIGAGYGRYTSELLENDLRVIATEPDEHIFNILDKNFEKDAAAKCLMAFVEKDLTLGEPVDMVCGFHVLHHLKAEDFAMIIEFCEQEKLRNKDFKGLFFYEPNPLNPLYPIQIACRSSMHFSEEKGMWNMGNMIKEVVKPSVKVETFSVGFFPPHKVLNALPSFLTNVCTNLSDTNAPFYAYKIFWFKF